MISNIPYVVCFGEVLWDIFPTGSKAGGAPFNVAYNLSKMGFDIKMLSRVGNDQLGQALVQKIEDWNITSKWIQKDHEKPTSTVIANFDEHNDAIYEIVNDVAWDRIELLPEHLDLVSKSGAFVFGSLCARNEMTRKTLLSLLEHATFKIFDVNFRPPFVDIGLIKELLYKTDVVKTNKAELRQILQFVEKDYTSEDEAVFYIQDYFNIPELILTKGSKGAKYYRDGKVYFYDAIPVEIADTVGSGDSFLAGFLSKRLIAETPEVVMKQAVSLGAFITSKFGACPEYSYEEFRSFRDNAQIVSL